MRLSELRNVFADGSICSETIELSQESSCGTHFEGAAPILREIPATRNVGVEIKFPLPGPRGAHRKNGKIPLPPGSSTSQLRISVLGHTFRRRPRFNAGSAFSFPLSKMSIRGFHRGRTAKPLWKSAKNPGKSGQLRITVRGHTFKRRPRFNARSVFSFPLSRMSIGGFHRGLRAAGP